ncbi:MAG: c-type cytochrome [Steroidobacteraceae bacterium]
MRILAAGFFVLTFCAACAGTGTREQEVRDVPESNAYEQMCASCHGAAGRGDGPIAPLIKTGVPDLTRIAQRNQGVFPTEQVHRTIDGRWDRPAHGARDMPVWGLRLYYSSMEDDPGERARVDARIEELVNYLRSIQVK